MQFNDGSGWQTLPQMAINAVPFANYANRAESLGDYTSTAYLRPSTLPTCTASQALTWDGSTFTCTATGGGGSTYAGVTSIANASGDITLAPAAGTGSIRVSSNTPSTSTTTGAVVITGGVGVSGAINAAGNISTLGNISTSGSIASTGSILSTTSMYTPQLYGTSTPSGDIKVDGTSNATKGNVLLASTGGNVGIGTTTPLAKLNVTNGSVLINGTTGATPVSGTGTRMMWIPAKAAFRAGAIDNASGGDEWDDTNIGWGSVAIGGDFLARGSTSVMMGWKNRNTYGNYAIGLGGYNTVDNDGAVGIGSFNSSTGIGAIALGDSNAASGDQSKAFGNSLIAGSYMQLALGSFNSPKVSENPAAWVATDPLFVVGNGTSAGARSNALMILKNGNIGVGTTSPTYALAVSGDINLTGAIRVNGSPITTSAWNTTSTDIYYNGGNVAVGTSNTTASGAKLTVQSDLAATGITAYGYVGAELYGDHDAIYIESGGNGLNVGGSNNAIYIGPSNTNALVLDRPQNSFLWGRSNAATNTNLVELTQDTSAYTGSGISMNFANGSGSFTGKFINLQSNSTSVFVVDSDGSLVVGTDTPTHKLHVVGPGGSTVGYFSDGAQTCSITPSVAGNITCSSDERLKKNIEPVSDLLSLEKILKLETVTYEWKSISNGRHTGFIAQEIEKTSPEFVVTTEDGFKQVSYAGFIPLITGSIKALYTKIIGHDSTIEEQKRKITNLENENTAMKKYLCDKDCFSTVL